MDSHVCHDPPGAKCSIACLDLIDNLCCSSYCGIEQILKCLNQGVAEAFFLSRSSWYHEDKLERDKIRDRKTIQETVAVLDIREGEVRPELRYSVVEME